MFIPIVVKLGPARFRRFLLDRVPSKPVQHMKRVSDVMHQRSLEIYNGKKAAIGRGDQETLMAVGEGKDMLSILRALSDIPCCLCGGISDWKAAIVKENMKAADEDRLPDSELLAQMKCVSLPHCVCRTRLIGPARLHR